MSNVNIPVEEFSIMVEKYKPTVIMEIGSLNGADSILFKTKFPDARVIAIEGLLENFEKFMKPLVNIEVYNVVINSYDGETTYHIKTTNGIHGIFDRGTGYGDKKIQVPCQRIDSFCKENNIQNIDIVKIDVEGATLEALRGFGDILNTVKCMHIETEDYEFFKGQKLNNEVHDFLRTKGFKQILCRGCEISQSKKQYDEVWENTI